MRTALHLGVPLVQAERWLHEELKRKTASDDTHPCLRDRILALNASCELPPEAAYSAAQILLGDTLADLQHTFDDLWLQYNGPRWHERFQTVTTAKGTILRMEKRGLQKP